MNVVVILESLKLCSLATLKKGVFITCKISFSQWPVHGYNIAQALIIHFLMARVSANMTRAPLISHWQKKKKWILFGGKI